MAGVGAAQLSGPGDDLAFLPSPYVRMLDDWCMSAGQPGISSDGMDADELHTDAHDAAGAIVSHADRQRVVLCTPPSEALAVRRDVSVYAHYDVSPTVAPLVFGSESGLAAHHHHHPHLQADHHPGMAGAAFDPFGFANADTLQSAACVSPMSAPRTHTVSFVSDVETTPSVTGPHDELHHSSQGSVSLSQASNGSALGFTRSFSYTPGMVFNPDSTAAASFLAAAGSCDTLLSHTDMFLPDFGANSCDGAGIPIPNNSASSTTPGAASSYHGSSSGLVLGSVAETPSPTGEFMPGMGAEPAVRRMSVDRSTPLHAPQRHLPWGTPVGMGSCDDTRSLFDTASEGGLEMYTRQASVPVGIPAVASVSAVDLNGVRGDLDYMFRPSSCPPAQFMALPQQGSGSLSRAPTAGSLPWAQDAAPSAPATAEGADQDGLNARHFLQVLAFQRQMQQEQHGPRAPAGNCGSVVVHGNSWGGPLGHNPAALLSIRPTAHPLPSAMVAAPNTNGKPGLFDGLKKKATTRRRRRSSVAAAGDELNVDRVETGGAAKPTATQRRPRGNTATRVKSAPAPAAPPLLLFESGEAAHTSGGCYACPWATCKRSLPQLCLLKEHIEAAHGKEFYQGLIVRGGGSADMADRDDGSVDKYLAAALRGRKRIILM